MVYHSSEAVLHNREKPFFLFDTGLLLHQLKVLGYVIRLRFKKKTLFEALSHLKVFVSNYCRHYYCYCM